MSTIKVNVIEPYSGSTVSIVGLEATASNAVWSGISGIPAGLVSGSYSSSMSTRITAQENFSSSLDATFATDADVTDLSSSASTSRDQISASLASDIVSGDSALSSSASTARDVLKSDLQQEDSALSSSASTARDALASDISTNADNISSNSSSAATALTNLSSSASTSRNTLATDYQSADSSLSSSLAASISANSDNVSNLEGKTLVSSSISGDSQGQIKVNGVNVNITSLQTTSNPTFAALTASSAIINNNLIVNGTASFAVLQSVTGSAKIIGDAFIVLNNNTPTERYAGISVYDSGSAGVTSSFQFDGSTNDWFYEYSDDGGVTTDHGVVIFGPEYDTKGSPTYLTSNTIPKSTGSHHIVDSNISDDGSTITLGSNTSITGTVVATGTPIVSGSAQIVLQSADKTGFTGASSITTLGTVTSGNVTAILPAGTVSGSAQIVLQSADKTGFTGATSITTLGTVTTGNVTAILPADTVSGSAQIVLQSADKTGFTGASSITTLGTVTSGNVTAILPAGTVSGSAQIDLGSATGTAANATSASFSTTASFALSAGGGLSAQTASTSLTMSANIAYVVTGTAAPITMSLPSSPTVGELIKFANMDDRATLLGRNGNNIMGLAEDMTLNVEQVSFDLVYVGPTAGWTIYGSRALS